MQLSVVQASFRKWGTFFFEKETLFLLIKKDPILFSEYCFQKRDPVSRKLGINVWLGQYFGVHLFSWSRVPFFKSLTKTGYHTREAGFPVRQTMSRILVTGSRFWKQGPHSGNWVPLSSDRRWPFLIFDGLTSKIWILPKCWVLP